MIASRRFDQQAMGLALGTAGHVIFGGQLNGESLARLVESSEANAYRALVKGADSRDGEFIAKVMGGAIVIVAPSVTTSLNLNRALGVGILEPATPALIDEIAREYASRHLSFGIEVGPFARPGDLSDWLRSRRMRRGMATAMVFRQLDAAVPPGAPSIDVSIVEGEDAELVARMCCEVFRMPESCRRLLASARDSAGWRHWLASIDGRPAGAAMSFVDGTTAWLGWDATLPEYRGKGVQASLIRRRLDDARRRGCHFATAETGVGTPERRDPSLRNYESEGFDVAYHRHTHVGLSAKPPTGISKGS